MLDVVTSVTKRISFQAIQNALVSVDTFFVLSGFLTAYLFFLKVKRSDIKRPGFWFLFYFHRFWRLTPPYLLFIGVIAGLFRYMGTGPLYDETCSGLEKPCIDNWWTNLLYINNLHKSKEQCIGWSWYLANDMQFFVISPIFLVAFLLGGATVGYAISVLGILICIICIAALEGHYGIGSNAHPNHFDYIYIKPYCRIGPYIVGIMAGYFLAANKGKLKIHKLLNFLFWGLSTAVALSVIYGLYEYNKIITIPGIQTGITMPESTFIFYDSVYRTVWGFAIAWVIIACSTGNGGPINWVLSWSGWGPLGKLNYSTYLNHGIVQFYCYMTLQSTLVVNDQLMILLFCGTLVLSYGVAIPMSLAFESPFLALEKIILPTRRGKREQQTSNTEGENSATGNVNSSYLQLNNN